MLYTNIFCIKSEGSCTNIPAISTNNKINIADQIRKKNSKDNDKTLKRIRENDPILTELNIGNGERVFILPTVSDLSKLGVAIEKNSYLKKLEIGSEGLYLLSRTDDYSVFLNGLKRNSSINELGLYFRGGILRVGHEVLKVFQEINNLTTLCINASIGNSETHQIVANTLRGSTNLKVIDLSHTNIADEQLSPMVDAVKGHNSLEELNLSHNRIVSTSLPFFDFLLAIYTH